MEQFGTVRRAFIKNIGSKRHGFVLFSVQFFLHTQATVGLIFFSYPLKQTPEEAKKALASSDETTLDNVKLKFSRAKVKTQIFVAKFDETMTSLV